MTTLSPEKLAVLLGQNFVPTQQQSTVISFHSGSLLVVAGAGAGKTATMASRVAWLVANGIAKPDEILGLTFTRKATRQLENKVSDALTSLSRRFDELPIAGLKKGVTARTLTDVIPTISTYDSYAERLVRDYGMLRSQDPAMRIINDIELYQRLKNFVHNAPLSERFADVEENTVVGYLWDLKDNMEKFLLYPEEVISQSRGVVRGIRALPVANARNSNPKPLKDIERVQEQRCELVGYVEKFNAQLVKDSLTTFSMQTKLAAELASTVPAVAEGERAKYKVVMLDEYQDTSYAHRVLLSYLFGRGAGTAVTAVGDPMQSIYGWNGAASDNLVQFLTDFPHTSQAGESSFTPARKLELTTSWRNPPKILKLANAVSSGPMGEGEDRFVSALRARENSDPGQVACGFFGNLEEEVDWVADKLAAQYRQCTGGQEPGVGEFQERSSPEFSAAILIRKNSQSAPYTQALRKRGVPCEVVGLKNLLDYPEVADVISIAKMVASADNDAATVRVLARPVMGLGLADLQALRVFVAAESRKQDSDLDDGHSHTELSVTEKLADLCKSYDSLPLRLSEIFSEPERIPGLSDSAIERIDKLQGKLDYLKRYSINQSIPQFFLDIIKVFGIREEILARSDREESRFGLAQLDQLLVEVEDYSRIPGATISDLLDYFSTPDDYMEAGGRGKSLALDSGDVEVAPGRVQILTVHKAKGLEWDTVAVVEADTKTYGCPAEVEKAKNSTWLTSVGEIPTQLMDKSLPQIPGLKYGSVTSPLSKHPVFDVNSIGTMSATNLKNAKKQFASEEQNFTFKESLRLFYVAITRARRCLLISGYEAAKQRPYQSLQQFHDQFPKIFERWSPDEAPVEEDVESASAPSSLDASQYERIQEQERLPEAENRWFPRAVVEDCQETGARMVKEYMAAFRQENPEGILPRGEGRKENQEVWEQEVTALIEERKKATSNEIVMPLPKELTTSNMVELKRDPDSFARNLVRPVPFRPSDTPRRLGTTFHEWVEDYYKASPILNIDDPEIDDEEFDQKDLDSLQNNFLQSRWAQRTPVLVEQPFNLWLDSCLVKGKIDAVFKESDGSWIILDWKTGQEPKPGSRKMDAALVQLSVYKLAWEHYCRQQGETDPIVKAEFFYVDTGHTVAPSLLDKDALLSLLKSTSDS